MSLLLVRLIQELGSDGLTDLKDFKSQLTVLFLLWSFLSGLILSELARVISDFADKRGLKDRYVNSVKKTANIDGSMLKEAIKKSKLVENGDLIQNTDLLNYLPMIYGTVQSDEKYKRLHNYASSETMYKNLTAAVLLGGIPEILFLPQKLQCGIIAGIVVVWILSVILLMRRYYRFRIKKSAYSLIWFIEKYQSCFTAEEQRGNEA
ncbi:MULTISPECIES: hypothetical protein [unclassified Blautia]|uniref:hypothetical protein n=1 Tax=unclassified Blautia TaxID=2648079 RepID=UPI001124682E|nr:MULTISPECIES: hypothetical protein [unclassified Blautia]